jgi:phosphate transport system substrate-binding protein
MTFILAGCGGGSTTNQNTGSTTSSQSSSATSLNGAGGTFPAPLYTKWFAVYSQLTGVEVNYQPVGSGNGITDITEGTVDFGASDAIMTQEQQATAEAQHGPILHIPMATGSVALIYNIPGVTNNEQLKLTPDVLADIYLKNIKNWNDPRITEINPGLTLPDLPIEVVYRADASGTTFIFTNYLSKVSTQWATQVGNATSVSWPGDVGGNLSSGVAAAVKQTPGTIGYVELSYALQNNMTMASLENAAGNYITPSVDSTAAAANGVDLPVDMKIMLTNSTDPNAYPIVGYTWILVYVNQTNKSKGEALASMLWWAIHDGQQYEAPLDYAPLTSAAVALAEKEIESINYQGQPFIQK